MEAKGCRTADIAPETNDSCSSRVDKLETFGSVEVVVSLDWSTVAHGTETRENQDGATHTISFTWINGQLCTQYGTNLWST